MSQPDEVTLWRNRTCGWVPCRMEDADEAWKALPAAEFTRLLTRVEAAEGALAFYADPKTYDATDFVDVGVGNMPIPGTSLVDYDGGERARRALRASGTREGGGA